MPKTFLPFLSARDDTGTAEPSDDHRKPTATKTPSRITTPTRTPAPSKTPVRQDTRADKTLKRHPWRRRARHPRRRQGLLSPQHPRRQPRPPAAPTHLGRSGLPSTRSRASKGTCASKWRSKTAAWPKPGARARSSGAWNSVLQGRDPRDAWVFTQRICGVCTTVHAIAPSGRSRTPWASRFRTMPGSSAT